MTLLERIPLPGTPGESFSEGINTGNNILNMMLRSKMAPYQMELMKAQSQEHAGKAGIQNILSSLMQQDLGISPITSGAPNKFGGQAQPGTVGNFRQTPGVSAPNKEKFMEWMERLGTLNPTAKEKAELDLKTAVGKAQAESDVKKISALEDVATGGIQSEPTYEAAAEIASNPEFSKMRDYPMAPELQLSYYKRAGTPEQIKMLTEFETYTNQFILDSVRKFPQRFTNSDLTFMLGMKPSPKDSIAALQAKLESAYAYDKIMSQRALRTAEIARKEGISVPNAMIKANQEINVKKIRDEIREKIKTKNEVENKAENKVEKNAQPETVNNKIDENQITLENLQYTAKQLNISVPEVLERLEKKGYKIPKNIPRKMSEE